MIECSRKKFNRFPQITWIQVDAQTYRGDTPYPLIVSSAALHWVSDLRKTFGNIFQCLEPDGFFSLGMMLRGTLKELYDIRREVAPQKTPATALPTMDELTDALYAAGFHIVRKQRTTEAVAYDDAAAFLRAIHEQGVTGSKVAATHIPLTRNELSRVIDLYQNRHRSPDGVTATYETATLLLTKKL